MYDDFRLVRSKRSKRRKQKFKSYASEFETSSCLNSFLSRKLEKISEKVDADQFTVDLSKDLNTILSNFPQSQLNYILCYGLGKFSENSCSLHQLAVLIFLRKTFNTVVRIFDPLFDSGEIDFLRALNFEVIEENEEGKHVVDGNKLTIIYLPHCPKQLVNNFLWANWSENLKSCIIICNSFSKILESNTQQAITDSANYIAKSIDFCDEIPVTDTYEFPNVFNDTSIHFFRKLETESHSDLFRSPAEEPKYSEVDTEFITKEIGRLQIG